MVAHLVADTRLTEFWALVDSVGSFGELADDARSEPLMGDRLTRPMPHARNALNDSLKGLAASLGRLFIDSTLASQGQSRAGRCRPAGRAPLKSEVCFEDS